MLLPPKLKANIKRALFRKMHKNENVSLQNARL